MSATARGLRELDQLDRVFAALAHESRRTILMVLHLRGGEMTSGAIAARFDHSWPTITRHLRVLEDAGLVQVTLHGRERIYRLDTGPLDSIARAWLDRFAHGPRSA
ncbi:MAG TPA: metalloregulator ArsR/SmtB family transcription factor [Pseudonocardiaceae bacterium]|nr:metalloregulator ArsR/SmtB family transcription factor [Pseudonocardiaceae bacterium]